MLNVREISYFLIIDIEILYKFYFKQISNNEK